MSNFDCYFRVDANAKDPKVRFWQNMQAKGITLEITVRLDSEESYLTSFNIHFYNDIREEVETPDEVKWERKLNDELIKMGVRACSIVNETLRLALTFRDHFEDPEVYYGDGIFNDVLISYFRNSPFAQDPGIAKRLALLCKDEKLINTSKENLYQECSQYLETIIIARARSLTKSLKYDQPKAESILIGALAYYLDERFSLSYHHLLGL